MWSKSRATALRLLTRTVSLLPASSTMRMSLKPYLSSTSGSQSAIAYVCNKMHDDLILKMTLPSGSLSVALLCMSRARLVRGPHSEYGG